MNFTRVEYERKVLAHLLSLERSFYETRNRLKKELFSDRVLRWFYQATKRYYESNNIGLPSWDYYRDELSRRGVDEAKILEANRVFRALKDEDLSQLSEVGYYVSVLYDLHLIRDKLTPSLEKVIEELEKGDAKAALASFSAASGELRLAFDDTPVVRTEVIDNFDSRYEMYLEKAESPEEYRGFSTGIKELDRITNGIQRGEFAAIMAPTAGGKSIQLLNVGVVNVLAGYNILYFTLEMPAIQVETRFDSRITRIEYGRFKKTQLNDVELEQWREKFMKLKERREEGRVGKFRIVDVPQGTPLEAIDSEIRLAIQEGFLPDIVIIDYAGIMGSQRRFNDQWERHNDNAMRLKALAKRYKMPGTDLPQFAIWTAYQLKDIKSARSGITTDDVALARRISDHLDLLIAFIQTEEDELEGILQVPIVKYRDGERGTLTVRPDFSTMRIEGFRTFDENENSSDDDFITGDFEVY